MPLDALQDDRLGILLTDRLSTFDCQNNVALCCGCFLGLIGTTHTYGHWEQLQLYMNRVVMYLYQNDVGAGVDGITTLLLNKTLWLDVANHMTSFMTNQSAVFLHSVVTLCKNLLMTLVPGLDAWLVAWLE